jgi:hypothetical protein
LSEAESVALETDGCKGFTFEAELKVVMDLEQLERAKLEIEELEKTEQQTDATLAVLRQSLKTFKTDQLTKNYKKELAKLEKELNVLNKQANDDRVELHRLKAGLALKLEQLKKERVLGDMDLTEEEAAAAAAGTQAIQRGILAELQIAEQEVIHKTINGNEDGEDKEEDKAKDEKLKLDLEQQIQELKRNTIKASPNGTPVYFISNDKGVDDQSVYGSNWQTYGACYLSVTHLQHVLMITSPDTACANVLQFFIRTSRGIARHTGF